MGKKLDLAETISWFRQFINVNIVFGLAAAVIRYYYNSIIWGIVIGVVGVLLGIIYAEWIRKKYGNSAYYNSLYFTKDNKDNKED